MVTEELEYLMEITLRNKHIIYRDEDGFGVVQIDKNGDKHERSIPSKNIERFIQLCRGRTVTVPQAKALFGSHCGDLDLPYSYGFKFLYYVQDMLLVLVATGEATMSKKGNGYIYSVGI